MLFILMEKEIIIKRLALIKQLYIQGIEQSHRSEGLSSFSILSFHDSIEMFLKLYCEFKNDQESYSFIKYWEKFPELPYREQMSSLSLRRKNLKHKGIFPAKLDIEHSKFATKQFLEETTPLIGDIKFQDISLTDLVSSEKVRILLREAEISISKGNSELVLENSAVAFKRLITYYEDKATDDYKSPFFFGDSLDFHSSFFMGLNDFDLPEQFKKIGEFVDKVKSSLEQIQQAIKVMSLGIDYRKYVKFKYLTPIVTLLSDDNYHAEIMSNRHKESYDPEELEFLISFVIESALKLQEFEIDYEKLNFKRPEWRMRHLSQTNPNN